MRHPTSPPLPTNSLTRISTPKLVVCDLDNTLYDWVGYFVPAFYAMVHEATKVLGCDKRQLLEELRRVHQKHHDTEHPFALLETETVKSNFPGLTAQQRAEKLDNAFHAFNSIRKERLKLYEGVGETIEALKAMGVTLVAHTEGKLISVLGRLERLGILHQFSAIYCRERSDTLLFSDADADEWLAKFPTTRIVELPHEDRKPNPQVLVDICASENIETSDTIYVGDSVSKDIYMAEQAGVVAAWARYGSQVDADDYDALVAVSHWTEDDVLREKSLRAAASDTKPDLILERCFSEVMVLFSSNANC